MVKPSVAAATRRPRDLGRQAASELLVAELKNEILDGSLRPGQSLREVDLCEQFGVARNTVREALRLLTRDGLGTHEVHRGVTVRMVSPAEVLDIFEFRALIEESVARRAGTLTSEEIERLEAALSDSEHAFSQGDSKSGTNGNLAFHRELVSLIGNTRIDNTFVQLLTETRLIHASMEERAGGHWIKRNRELLGNLVAGQGEAFRANLAEYINIAVEEATGSLPRQ
ncbi:GntR family transcriptional regulator [Rhodococcus sp. KBS0724]|uniref:GntR family transcriptional regulator n=1 Tax=Rhodococcus sp. KBS0724 TaxID=1179674 RepID=UPI00163DE64F|nr:GntR family transcriptional regulator [Rhodococcus sp. KBS0724]